MDAQQLVFDPKDLAGNATKLVGHYKLSSEADVSLLRFTLAYSHGSTETVVKEGKYKTALLLLYLSDLFVEGQADGWRGAKRSFLMNARLRDIARVYFGDEICNDAIHNPDTKHASVKMLLQDGVRVTIILKD